MSSASQISSASHLPATSLSLDASARPFSAVLWDLDGTLVDTGDLHFTAWRKVMAEWGIDYTHDDFMRDFGRSNPEILRAIFPAESDESLVGLADEKEERFRREMIGKVALLPGVLNWLRGFKAAGIPQVVCSSGPTANIAATVVEVGIADYFAGLLSGVHVPNGKPAPDLFLRGAAAVDVEPADCLVIEDSHHGVEGAARAGMSCVVVGKLAGNLDRVESLFNDSAQLWGIETLDQRPFSTLVVNG